MNTYNTIMATLCSCENLDKVWQLAESAESDLVILADLVCKSFNFTDTDGNLQTSECMQALLSMESQEIIALRSSPACKQHVLESPPELATSPDQLSTGVDANHIKKILSSTENLSKVRQLAKSAEADLIALADLVCQSFNFTDSDGNLQTQECIEALLSMEAEELASLRSNFVSEPEKYEKKSQIRIPHGCLPYEIAVPKDVPATVNELKDLQLVLVSLFIHIL